MNGMMGIKRLRRFAVYLVGMFLLAVGIILNTKTAMGVSPLVSLAYCASCISGYDFANATMIMYLGHFAIQVVLKGRRIRPFDFLQLPFCFAFTRCMSWLASVLPSPESIPLRLGMLVLAVLCTGFGVALTVSMHLVPNPADGMVGAISEKVGKNMGFTKNAVDAVSVCLTLILGLSFSHRVVGVGFGTVCAVLGVGRAVALCHLLFGRLLVKVYEEAPIPMLGEG